MSDETKITDSRNSQVRSLSVTLFITVVILLGFLLFYFFIPKDKPDTDMLINHDSMEGFSPRQQGESFPITHASNSDPVYDLDMVTQSPSLELKKIVLPELEKGKSYHIEVIIKEVN